MRKKCYYCGVEMREGIPVEAAYVREFKNGTEIAKDPFEGAKRVYLCSGCR